MSDLTSSTAWQALVAQQAQMTDTSIADLVAREPGRMDAMCMTIGDVLVDFSKHLADATTMDLLRTLALHQDVMGWFERMCAGELVNVTEGRAAVHTLLRNPYAPAEVADVLARMKTLAEDIRTSNVRDVVHIGIGGSDLGPRLVYDALCDITTGPRVHFVSNVDPDDLARVLKSLDPATTFVTVASKTFTTHETMLNLQAAIDWLGNTTRIVALTANAPEAVKLGIEADHILPMWDWVGGRFSVWSSIGFPVIVGCGFDAFQALLAGAYAADQHARTAAPEQNIPLTMALLGVWYRNFWGAGAHAVLPYSQRMAHFPAYLQQLEMESNGKSVTRDGQMCAYATAPVIFGQPGTNGQHAFYQMLHQGADIIPCDFIGAVKPALTTPKALEQHRVLMANMLAQSRGLMLGRHGVEFPKICPGNRPSATILLPVLDAYNLGFYWPFLNIKP